tara:strand:+ start:428 stop:715 length:288 start_codon:yes stop_codon:yes gene_type:complete
MQTVKEKIRQRRSQMLVHSYLYYKIDSPIVDDDTWQKWANELAELQRKNPDDCQINFYDKEFKDWNGDTGFHLPLNDRNVRMKAQQILNIHNERK